MEVGIPVGPPRAKDGKVYGLTKQQWQSIIRLLIHKKHAKRGWVTFDEMRDGTGSDHRRTIDVFAFGIWPSTRYQKVCYEIKTDRGDFMTEMKNPGKWKAWQSLANEFWYVTLPGVVKEGEVPACCGHLEVQKSRLVVKKHAPYKETGEIPNKLMASILARMRHPQQEFYENVASITYAGRWLSRKQFDAAVGHVVAQKRYTWRTEYAKEHGKAIVGNLKGAGQFPVHDNKCISAGLAQDILREVFSWFGDLWARDDEPVWMQEVYPAQVRYKLYSLSRAFEKARSALEAAGRTIEHGVERMGHSKHSMMKEKRHKRPSLRARRRRRRRE